MGGFCKHLGFEAQDTKEAYVVAAVERSLPEAHWPSGVVPLPESIKKHAAAAAAAAAAVNCCSCMAYRKVYISSLFLEAFYFYLHVAAQD